MIPEKNHSRLFGTDGIRQTVGHFPLDRDSIFRLGCVLGEFTHGSRIAVGRDTRQSGLEIENLLKSALAHHSQVQSCGIIPTPGLSYIVSHCGFDYGIMITASHNPFTDNGIKIFDRNGEKLPPQMEHNIEKLFFHMSPLHAPTLPDNASPGLPGPTGWTNSCEKNHPDMELCKEYQRFLTSHIQPVQALRVILDCAQGATFAIAPHVFQATDLDIHVIHASPDGCNINRNCGSTSLGTLQAAVATQHADIGIAFDGDGDRVLMVDKHGRLLEGDHTLYLLARYFQTLDLPFPPHVVGTVMSNLALEKALEKIGIQFFRSQVGDKYVYEDMITHDAILGGEPSGHTILRQFQRTGDGILTALYFLIALTRLAISPAQLFDLLPLYPQVIRNLKIKEKRNLETWPELQDMIATFYRDHGTTSRLLIRYSGTEPKIRLMMESLHPEIIENHIDSFTHLIESTIGIRETA